MTKPLSTMTLLLCSAAASLLAAPAFAQNCAPLKQVANIKLTRNGAAGMGAFLVPTVINGTPKQLILGGSAVTVLFPDQLKELGLQRREVRSAPAMVRQNLFFTNLVTAAGQRSEEYTHVDTLQLGTAGQFTNSDFMIGPDLPGGRARPNPNVAGTMGLDLLSHFDMELDLANATLNLFSMDHCDGQVVYWKNDSVSAIPIRFDTKGRMRVKVTLDGTELDAVVDPASVQDIVNLNVAEDEMKFDKKAADVQRGPDQPSGAEVYRHTFKTLSLQGLQIQNPLIVLVEDKLRQHMNQNSRIGTNVRNAEDNREPDMTIGLNLLNKLHVYAAFKEKKLYVTAATPAP